jgi:hypothetical protein
VATAPNGRAHLIPHGPTLSTGTRSTSAGQSPLPTNTNFVIRNGRQRMVAIGNLSRGDCTEWPGTFNPSRANVIGRDAFNLGWIRRRPENGRQPLLGQTMSDKLAHLSQFLARKGDR